MSETIDPDCADVKPVKIAARQAFVPTNIVGTLLDYGKASAHALKLIAIKSLKGDGFVLNETYVRDRYNVKREAFQAGIRLLKQTGVLERSQPNHRAYAKEVLGRKSDNFVAIDEALLIEDRSAPLIGFILAVKVSMRPGHPLDFSKRIGVTSRNTASKLARKAIAYGCVFVEGVGTEPMMVARGGLEIELHKKQPAIKQPPKKQPAHSNCKKGTVYERTPQNLKALSHSTTNPDGFGGLLFQGELKDREIILTNWRRSAFWRGRDLQGDDKIEIEKSCIDSWRWHLQAYGGAPKHMGTMHSFRQAVEMAHELAACMGEGADNKGFILQALAYWVCKAHSEGRTIRSLGFITEPLARQCDLEDHDWCFSYPSRLPDAEYAHVLDFAENAVRSIEGHGISVIDHKLLSTQGIEDLAGAFQRHGQNAFVASANSMINAGEKPSDGCSVIRWSWFEKHIQVEQPRKGRGRR